MAQFRYLHQHSPHTFWLDHRIVPEARAMLAAMMSRAPSGGVRQRYRELLLAIAEDLYDNDHDRHESDPPWGAVVKGEACPTGIEYADVYVRSYLSDAEESLTTYPLPKRVQNPDFDKSTYDRKTKCDANGEKPGFFDEFVLLYGHSSVMELTGLPCVLVEGLTRWGAWMTFDNRLVRGQETSTRAVWRADWKMGCEVTDPMLAKIHHLGLEIAAAEIAAWKEDFRKPCPLCCEDDGTELSYTRREFPGRFPEDGETLYAHRHQQEGEALPMPIVPWKCVGNQKKRSESDPTYGGVRYYMSHEGRTSNFLTMPGNQSRVWFSADECSCMGTRRKHPTFDPQAGAFRPAFDRARWALPGTISTGVSHCGDMRTMGRVLAQMRELATRSKNEGAMALVDEIEGCYAAAMPGLASMWLREPVVGEVRPLDSHLPSVKDNRVYNLGYTDSVKIHRGDVNLGHDNMRPRVGRSYADERLNHAAHVQVTFVGSMAAMTDWHRQRTLMPWSLRVLGERLSGEIVIAEGYEPISDFGKANVEKYLRMVNSAYDTFIAEGNIWAAMNALPLGTRMHMRGGGGLKDALYCFELRAFAHGANFEYQGQAATVLDKTCRNTDLRLLRLLLSEEEVNALL